MVELAPITDTAALKNEILRRKHDHHEAFGVDATICLCGGSRIMEAILASDLKRPPHMSVAFGLAVGLAGEGPTISTSAFVVC